MAFCRAFLLLFFISVLSCSSNSTRNQGKLIQDVEVYSYAYKLRERCFAAWAIQVPLWQKHGELLKNFYHGNVINTASKQHLYTDIDKALISLAALPSNSVRNRPKLLSGAVINAALNAERVVEQCPRYIKGLLLLLRERLDKGNADRDFSHIVAYMKAMQSTYYFELVGKPSKGMSIVDVNKTEQFFYTAYHSVLTISVFASNLENEKRSKDELLIELSNYRIALDGLRLSILDSIKSLSKLNVDENNPYYHTNKNKIQLLYDEYKRVMNSFYSDFAAAGRAIVDDKNPLGVRGVDSLFTKNHISLLMASAAADKLMAKYYLLLNALIKNLEELRRK